MKKIYSLTLSLIAALAMYSVALPASAAQQYARYQTDGNCNIFTHFTKGEDKARNAHSNILPTKSFAPASRVTEVPDGKDVLYESSRMCIISDYIVDNTGLTGIIRYCDTNRLYFYDMFSLGEDIYIEASIDETGRITIPTHQFFATDPTYGDITLEVSKFVSLPNGNTDSDILRDKEAYYLQRHDDGTITSIDSDKDWMDREYPVLCNEKGIVLALTGNIVMKPVTEEVVTPPAGIDPVEYTFTYTEGDAVYAQPCNVVTDNNDVYIQGMVHYFQNSWLKATFSDDRTKLIMKSGQLLGYKLYVNYFNAAHRTTAEIDGKSQLVWELDSELALEVGEDGTTFTFPKDEYFTITIAGDVDYPIHSGKLAVHVDKAVKPATPIISGVDWVDVDALFFTIPPYDVDGNYINPDNLSWRLYYDDVLFTFDPSEYSKLKQPMTEIPYGFKDTAEGWDFWEHYGEFVVAIYNYDYKNIGIESVCTVNGESVVSDRAYYGERDGVSDVTASKTVTATEIYNLSGIRVSGKLAPGLYIRTDTYSDGSKRSVKIIVR